MTFHLNQRAWDRIQGLGARTAELEISVRRGDAGTILIDASAGGLQTGLLLAELCLAGLATVQLVPSRAELANASAVAVQVYTDQPVAACMASQYAGWKLAHGKFFAMGSGPMRAAAASEELFRAIGHQEKPSVAVGVLETRDPPPSEICQKIAAATGVAPPNIALAFAPTASQPGNVQVVARSVETALHKLFELGFDLRRVVSGFGLAPLPPVAKNDLAGIGRTNDAILYGGEVTLWVRGDDASLSEIVSRIPSKASKDFGEPFGEIFRRYGGDFYKIDPHLFSPAVITLANLDSGRTFRSGELRPDVLAQSFTS